MQVITPEWRPHIDLEVAVNQYLDSLGFRHGAATYHEVLPKDLQRLLQRNDDPTSLYIRTRSDRLAVHQRIKNCSFQYEVKTPTGNYSNLALEAIQLAQHVAARGLGVRTLYIYRDDSKGIDCGFWNTSIPTISCIKVPPGNEGIEGLFATAFPNVPMQRIGKVRGSGDPFCLVEYSEVARLRSWQHIIADFVAGFE